MNIDDSASSAVETPRSEKNTATLKPAHAFAFLAVYFGLQLLSRTFISNTVDLDESEQLILTQRFSWGYGPQPPLYAWIQALAFSLFGLNTFALALVKNILLFATCALTFMSGYAITRDTRCAFAAMLSLFFLPQFAWESQRDLTHSVLASTLSAGTLFGFFRLIERPSTRMYIVLGFLLGLGVLAKYNYLVVAGGLAAAALSLERTRKLLFDRRILSALTIAALLVLPHLFWTYRNPELVFSTAGKFQFSEHGRGLISFLTWLTRLFLSAGLFSGPLLVLYLALFWRSPKAGPALVSRLDESSRRLFTQLIARKLVFILIGLILAGMFLPVTNFKERWFQPILVSLPVLLVAMVQGSINRSRWRCLSVLAGLVAFAVLVSLPARVASAPMLKRPTRLNSPFRELANQIRALGLTPDLIIAEDRWIGGNLRLTFPSLVISVPEIRQKIAAQSASPLLVWDATKTRDLPQSLKNHFVSLGGRDPSEIKPQYVEAPYLYDTKRRMRLGLIPAASSNPASPQPQFQP
ncbi:MAG: hypothetical protein FJ403_09230 [Verrucomicrobia bacterium]|nr:hypothetical protein [Verrucomicrobiota bacterium]